MPASAGMTFLLMSPPHQAPIPQNWRRLDSRTTPLRLLSGRFAVGSLWLSREGPRLTAPPHPAFRRLEWPPPGTVLLPGTGIGTRRRGKH